MSYIYIIFIIVLGICATWLTKYFQSKNTRILLRILIFTLLLFPFIGLSLDLYIIRIASIENPEYGGYGWFPIMTVFATIITLLISPIVYIVIIAIGSYKKIKQSKIVKK